MKGLTFQEAVLTGLADDEGLLVPELIPNVASHLQVCLFIVVFVLCVVVCGSSRRHAVHAGIRSTQSTRMTHAAYIIHYTTTLHVIIHNNILYDRTIFTHARRHACAVITQHARDARACVSPCILSCTPLSYHPIICLCTFVSFLYFVFFIYLFVVYINLVIFQKWENLSFAELSLEIMSLFVSEDEIPRAGLRRERGR